MRPRFGSRIRWLLSAGLLPLLAPSGCFGDHAPERLSGSSESAGEDGSGGTGDQGGADNGARGGTSTGGRTGGTAGGLGDAGQGGEADASGRGGRGGAGAGVSGGGSSAGTAAGGMGGGGKGGGGASGAGTLGGGTAGGGAAGMSGSAGTGGGEPFCGDGTTDPGEECDDGNRDYFDGCEPTCHVDRCEQCILTDCAVASETAVEDFQGAIALCSSGDFTGDGVPDLAGFGPAQGSPMSELCLAAFDCVIRTGCGADAADVYTSCYCGDINGDGELADNDLCLAAQGNALGPCLSEIEDGYETRLPNEIIYYPFYPAKAAGVALLLASCLGQSRGDAQARVCWEACYGLDPDAVAN